MTGFGRGESCGEAYLVTVEARSVNHRHLDVALRLPKALSSLEPEIRKLVGGRFERGRIDLAVQLAPAPGRAEQRVVVDNVLAREYVERARALASETGLAGDVDLAWIVERPGVIRLEDSEPPAPATLLPTVADAVTNALESLVAQRTVEGASLAAALGVLASDLEGEVEVMEKRAPAAAARREAKLRERLASLVGELGIDENRILTEAAAWAERTDVTEELARLRSHLDQMRSMLDKGGPIGRQLDFLIQELHREVNTVGSKADDLEVSQAMLTAKGVIEKMREQIQNLE
jgi:uncharacterized protein (TIGR00255 family)